MTFKYVAKDRDGKNVAGTLDAGDRTAALGILRKKDLIIISLDESKSRAIFSASFGMKKKVKIDDLVIFSRQLATMVDAGIPLVGALDILGEQMDNKTFSSVILVFPVIVISSSPSEPHTTRAFFDPRFFNTRAKTSVSFSS